MVKAIPKAAFEMLKKKNNKVSPRRRSLSSPRVSNNLGNLRVNISSDISTKSNGTKKKVVGARKEGGVRFVHVNPDDFQSPPAFGPKDVRSVLCLDLGEFGHKAAIRWVRAATERRLHNPNSVVPSIVVIGSTADMSPELADRVEEAINDAGAVFFETTEKAPTFDAALCELRKEMDEIYKGAERNGAGYFTSEQGERNGARQNGRKANVSRDSSHDLSPYFDNNHKIDDADFEFLTERMELPDDSPEFED